MDQDVYACVVDARRRDFKEHVRYAFVLHSVILASSPFSFPLPQRGTLSRRTSQYVSEYFRRGASEGPFEVASMRRISSKFAMYVKPTQQTCISRSRTAELTFTVTSAVSAPLSGDKHDYQSMGYYWWPCNEALKVCNKVCVKRSVGC